LTTNGASSARKARSLTNTGRRASAISLPITAGVIGLLWLWTILASDAPRLVVTVFWVVIGVVFVAGQDFSESARFPSLDFSLVYPLDEQGRPVEMFIEKRGGKAARARTIPAAVKKSLNVPHHLEVCTARLDDLEALLR
jgi:hypothetical protein